MAATIYEPLSTAHLKSCTVDFDSRPDKKAVNLVQYDQTIPVLCVSLKKGGTEYKVPSDADVNIRMDKRDGYHVYNPALGVNAERTIAYFAVTPQMSTGWGDYYPIVEITVGGGIAGSAPIWLHFDRNPLPENAIISSDEYKTIQQLLEDVTAVKAATEQIKAQTEAVRDQAKGFADNAKNSADKAQTLVDGMPSDYSQAMKDIGTLKNQMQRAYPDDSTIGENPWSSKHIIDMLCPPLEETGNPVVCYPVENYPLGVVASWEPVQEGRGEPSPDNIRPIKGRDSVTVERCGRNLLNPAKYEATTKTINGITFTRLDTGEVVVNGTATGTAVYVLIKNFPYQISLSTDRNWMIVSKNVISAQGLVSGVTLVRPSDNTRLYVRVESGITVKNTVIQPQIEKSTTAPTTYTPYIGSTNTLTLPETVYGGEVDAVTGEGKETWKTLTLDGTENWTFQTTNSPGKKGFVLQVPEIATPEKPAIKGDIVCSQYPGITATDTYQCKNGISVESQENHYFRIYNDTYAGGTVDDWKSYLAAQHEAGTPVQVCYKLAEPVPFTATGAQALPALAGLNTILTDADSVTVTGRADPIKRIEDLEAAVASIN